MQLNGEFCLLNLLDSSSLVDYQLVALYGRKRHESIFDSGDEGHSFSAYAKCSVQLTFLTPDTHTYMCLSGDKNCQFLRKFCVHTK